MPMALLLSWLMPVAMWPYQPSQASMAAICRDCCSDALHLVIPGQVMQCAHLLPVGYTSFASQQNTYNSAAQMCMVYYVLYTCNTASMKQTSGLCRVQDIRRVLVDAVAAWRFDHIRQSGSCA